MSERMEEPRDPQAEMDGTAAPDPWRDAPHWSEPAAIDVGADAAAASAAGPNASAETADAVDTSDTAGPATCPWCATPALQGARTCTNCGAALAQRESIGDLVIPGLTAVDPALQDLADRPLHLTGPSPSQGVASGAIAAAAMGGPMGIAILGGVAAVAAAEFVGANRPGGDTPVEHVGQASGAALQAIEKLERGEALPAADSTTPRPELEATHAPGPEPATQEETADGGD